MIDIPETITVPISNIESLESNENGEFSLKEKPTSLFIYNKKNGEKISFELDNKLVKIDEPYLDVIAHYVFDYNGGASQIQVGRRLLNGFVELEARTRVKDDTTGQVVTGLIKIPKLKLMSDLSIRLGAQASPVVANFSAVGVPVGSRGNSSVAEFYILNNDIDSDF